MKDFFVSYNNADRAWAEWIAWQLEAANYTTVIQAWDFRPGSNFVLEMQQAASEARRTIAVLSRDYLDAVYTHSEWAAAFTQDPTGEQGTLLPVRVGECELKGLMSPIVYIDLIGVEETVAKEALLAGVERGRAKPTTAPGFPGTPPYILSKQPHFPMAWSWYLKAEGIPNLYEITPHGTRRWILDEDTLMQLGGAWSQVKEWTDFVQLKSFRPERPHPSARYGEIPWLVRIHNKNATYLIDQKRYRHHVPEGFTRDALTYDKEMVDFLVDNDELQLFPEDEPLPSLDGIRKFIEKARKQIRRYNNPRGQIEYRGKIEQMREFVDYQRQYDKLRGYVPSEPSVTMQRIGVQLQQLKAWLNNIAGFDNQDQFNQSEPTN